ncbi:alpha-ketoacid dehydrogenase subunit beta [Nocardia nova]|jgi:pyruvate dehydrogenase E1 component beta subunit|uniref:3-methyl-2-oxobutanoate dehydrogenase subunit beta n=1 Tax=Nocardia cerradoensis TaxID=85688 RepID=A0A231H2V3_9NOCA|nr:MULTISPECIES: pyruvate dehydrogenase complex E1 component subunit beta [Nocardia]MBV7707009.1 alpha-ketoacid dehydrogenase subunit beta [Nocardia nova]OXR43179.1 Pyruvate dehydrogenase E1 component subunit beta [Nocardia cerradoensis]PPJ12018.1 alpha-ketoacid dehydrogenase subunit beta [Nocardia nova]PPJ16415.1 alpha-ketoacid dehydrogenase subunit beta [Nocardia nova]
MTIAEQPVQTRTLGFVQAINDALDIALETDERVFALGEDIQEPGGGGFGVFKGLGKKYGTQRIRHTPISEQAIMGAAIGAAISGLRPVPEIMLMNFTHVCMDQLVNHAAKLRYMSGGRTPVPITVRTATGAGGGFGAQHSDMLEAQLVHAAGLKVVVPSNPADAKGLLLSSIFDDDPVVFVEMFGLYFASRGEVPVGDHRVPLGKAAIARPGSDVTILTYGRQVVDCLAVAEQLATEGIDVEVVDLRTLQPLDIETVLASVAKTKRAVVVHEAVRRNGFGAELAATIHSELFGELAGPVARVTAPNTPVPYAKSLEQAYIPGPPQIEAAVRGLL